MSFTIANMLELLSISKWIKFACELYLDQYGTLFHASNAINGG